MRRTESGTGYREQYVDGVMVRTGRTGEDKALSSGVLTFLPVDQVELDRTNPRIRRFLEIHEGEATYEQVALALDVSGAEVMRRARRRPKSFAIPFSRMAALCSLLPLTSDPMVA
jgi:hypothetical protein